MRKEHLTRLTTYGLIIEKEHRRFCSLLLRILIYKQKEQRRFDLKQDGSVFKKERGREEQHGKKTGIWQREHHFSERC